MSESSTSPTPQTQFPRSTNSLLDPSEKEFIDKFPDELVKAIMAFDDSHIRVSLVVPDGVTTLIFNGERATAVRDYLEMQFAYGLRNDPR